MKITMNIDCTPEEARALAGLPDVQPLQDALMRVIQERMQGAVQATDPAHWTKNLFPGAEGIQQLQQLFWNGVQTSMQQGMDTAMRLTDTGRKR